MRKLKTEITEIDGLTGTDMCWKATGEVNKDTRAVKIVNGEYTAMN